MTDTFFGTLTNGAAKVLYNAVIYYTITLLIKLNIFFRHAVVIHLSVAKCMQLALVWFSTRQYETAANVLNVK